MSARLPADPLVSVCSLSYKGITCAKVALVVRGPLLTLGCCLGLCLQVVSLCQGCLMFACLSSFRFVLYVFLYRLPCVLYVLCCIRATACFEIAVQGFNVGELQFAGAILRPAACVLTSWFGLQIRLLLFA